MRRKILASLSSIEFWACGLLIVLVIGLSQNWTWVRGPAEWRWKRYPLPGIEERVWLPIVVCLVVGLITYRLSTRPAGQPHRRTTWLVPAFLVVASLAVQAALLYLEHPNLLVTLFYRTVSQSSGGYFNVASGITNVGDFLRNYPALMPGFAELHPRTHPPGLPLLFWGASQVLAAWPTLIDPLAMNLRLTICQNLDFMRLSNATLGSAIVQMSTPIWGALAAVPLFALARRLCDEATARRGLSLYIFTPALVLWATRWNQLYAFLMILSLYLLQRGLDRRRGRWYVMAGVVVSLATFLDFANLALGFASLLYVLVFRLQVAQRAGRLSLRQVIDRHLIVALMGWTIGVVSIWVIYYLASGVTFFEALRAGLGEHAELNRTYAVWVGYNLYDFFLFMGIATSLVAAQAAWRIGRARPVAAIGVPVLTFWITLLALDLSGIVRGEVARLWLFLVPVAILAALPGTTTWTRRSTAILLGVQVAQLLVCGFFLRTVGSGLPYYEPREAQTAMPTIAQPLTASFGQGGPITLLGYDLSNRTPQAGGTLDVTLYWRAKQRLAYSATVFVHLLDEAGQLRAQHDGLPQNGTLPTTCWLDGEIIRDKHTLTLDPALPAGTYSLQVGLYRYDLLQAGDPNHRLPVVSDDQSGTHLDIGVLQVSDAQ